MKEIKTNDFEHKCKKCGSNNVKINYYDKYSYIKNADNKNPVIYFECDECKYFESVEL